MFHFFIFQNLNQPQIWVEGGRFSETCCCYRMNESTRWLSLSRFMCGWRGKARVCIIEGPGPLALCLRQMCPVSSQQ